MTPRLLPTSTDARRRVELPYTAHRSELWVDCERCHGRALPECPACRGTGGAWVLRSWTPSTTR